jgi:hypothetical protein
MRLLTSGIRLIVVMEGKRRIRDTSAVTATATTTTSAAAAPATTITATTKHTQRATTKRHTSTLRDTTTKKRTHRNTLTKTQAKRDAKRHQRHGCTTTATTTATGTAATKAYYHTSKEDYTGRNKTRQDDTTGGSGSSSGTFRKRRSGTAFWNACLQCEHMLHLLGVPVVRAKAEGEALCALLNQHNIVDGVISNDGDCLLFGATVLYTRFSLDNLDKGQVIRYDANDLHAILRQCDDVDIDVDVDADVSDRMDMDVDMSTGIGTGMSTNMDMGMDKAELGRFQLSRDDLIAFAILTGSDLAGSGMHKVGHMKAIRFIRKCQLDNPLHKATAAMNELRSWEKAAAATAVASASTARGGGAGVMCLPINTTSAASGSTTATDILNANANAKSNGAVVKAATTATAIASKHDVHVEAEATAVTEVTREKGEKQGKCCSRCSHTGTKSHHKKHGCTMCGTEPGEACYELTTEDRFRMFLRTKSLQMKPHFDPSHVHALYMRPNDNQLPIDIAIALQQQKQQHPHHQQQHEQHQHEHQQQHLFSKQPQLGALLAMTTIVKGRCLQESRDYLKRVVGQLLSRAEVQGDYDDVVDRVDSQSNTAPLPPPPLTPYNCNMSASRERPVPIRITRSTTRHGIASYEIEWHVQATLTDEHGEDANGYSYTTMENKQLIDKKWPSLVQAYQQVEAERKKQGDGEQHRRRAFIEMLLGHGGRDIDKDASANGHADVDADVDADAGVVGGCGGVTMAATAPAPATVPVPVSMGMAAKADDNHHSRRKKKKKCRVDVQREQFFQQALPARNATNTNTNANTHHVIHPPCQVLNKPGAHAKSHDVQRIQVRSGVCVVASSHTTQRDEKRGYSQDDVNSNKNKKQELVSDAKVALPARQSVPVPVPALKEKDPHLPGLVSILQVQVKSDDTSSSSSYSSTFSNSSHSSAASTSATVASVSATVAPSSTSSSLSCSWSDPSPYLNKHPECATVEPLTPRKPLFCRMGSLLMNMTPTVSSLCTHPLRHVYVPFGRRTYFCIIFMFVVR